ncbi:general stress protein [Agromyces mariniharenae]|uniref:general stress protein n=1 Tax=Agromyces mariniharenae TaxID=2604423 RepID=UPI0016531C0B|nr:general stress protein [Agromyces mariniharenae]
MSNPGPFGGRTARQFPTLPKGETVASFETYQEAQAAVDKLAKAAFPVKELAIVGTDLTSVERITGVLTWGRAAGAGALSGAWFGTFLGLLFFIFSPTGAGLGILGSAILIGAGFGMIFGLVSYSINRRRRDFTSVMQVLATRYAIIAEPEHVARARTVLGTDAAGLASAAPRPVVTPTAPSAPPTSSQPVAGEPDAPAPAAPQPGAAEGEDAARPLTYGEAQDAARRAARERRDAGES